jgi:heme/copper-type cytochrome/quinol oxidase subunit 2
VDPVIVLLLLGLVTETAIAIATYRVAEARGFNARMWAVIGFVTGVIGLIVVCLVRGRPAEGEGDPQA